jgi:phosphatidylinositol glycan class M
VLLTLYCALKDRWDAAAILLGVSTHWKVFPVIYGVGCLGVIGRSMRGGKDSGLIGWVRSVVNWKTVRFGVLSAGTFVALGAACYLMWVAGYNVYLAIIHNMLFRWGYPFLYESYLYHIHRLDHRHNFSPYFYLTYLTYPSLDGAPVPPPVLPFLRSPLISFVPQMTLSLGTGLLFGRRKEDLIFTWFVQTAVFVLFNKVCTSQVRPAHSTSTPYPLTPAQVFPLVPATPPTPPAAPQSHSFTFLFAPRCLGGYAGALALRSV